MRTCLAYTHKNISTYTCVPVSHIHTRTYLHIHAYLSRIVDPQIQLRTSKWTNWRHHHTCLHADRDSTHMRLYLHNVDNAIKSILNTPYRVCLSVCCTQCIHLVFIVSTRNFSRTIACILDMFLHLNRRDFLIRAAVGRQIRTLSDWRQPLTTFLLHTKRWRH
jgi:hypothetical protein